jgi:osmotically-inducible protein OsmY
MPSRLGLAYGSTSPERGRGAIGGARKGVDGRRPMCPDALDNFAPGLILLRGVSRSDARHCRQGDAMGKIGRSAVLAALAGLLAVAPSASGAERPGDAEITEWVEEAIAAEPRVRGSVVEVEAREGIVTLSGSVATLAGRRYAVLAAQKILGVLSVTDQLEIEAPSRADSDVAADVRWRIQNSQFVDSRKLGVIVLAGTVQLAGEVGSGSQRYEAELLASEVAGVRGIENFLSADVDPKRSDAQIQKDVTATLRRDVYLARLPIEVAVKKGEVTLTGSVESAYERARATSRIRWVDGVRAVQNQLQVEWWEDGGAHVAAPAPRTDAELAATVSEQLEQDVRVDASRIQVAADRGRVILQGRVDSLRQKRIAEEDAWNVAGVGWVANELEVVAAVRPDAEILREIRSAMVADSELSDAAIEVRVEAGVVTLEGRVASGYQRVHAGAITSRTRGVERVHNRLVAATWDARADGELEAEVKRRLARDSRTADFAEWVSVRVDGGVVTLTGTVERWVERRSAGHVAAITRGVRKVSNRIVVQPYPYPWDERMKEVDPEGTPEWDPYYFDRPTLP